MNLKQPVTPAIKLFFFTFRTCLLNWSSVLGSFTIFNSGCRLCWNWQINCYTFLNSCPETLCLLVSWSKNVKTCKKKGGIWDYELLLQIWIGYSDWGLGLGDCDFRLGLEIKIVIEDWDLGLGIDNWDWRLGLEIVITNNYWPSG